MNNTNEGNLDEGKIEIILHALMESLQIGAYKKETIYEWLVGKIQTSSKDNQTNETIKIDIDLDVNGSPTLWIGKEFAYLDDGKFSSIIYASPQSLRHLNQAINRIGSRYSLIGQSPTSIDLPLYKSAQRGINPRNEIILTPNMTYVHKPDPRTLSPEEENIKKMIEYPVKLLMLQFPFIQTKVNESETHINERAHKALEDFMETFVFPSNTMLPDNPYTSIPAIEENQHYVQLRMLAYFEQIKSIVRHYMINTLDAQETAIDYNTFLEVIRSAFQDYLRIQRDLRDNGTATFKPNITDPSRSKCLILKLDERGNILTADDEPIYLGPSGTIIAGVIPKCAKPGDDLSPYAMFNSIELRGLEALLNNSREENKKAKSDSAQYRSKSNQLVY